MSDAFVSADNFRLLYTKFTLSDGVPMRYFAVGARAGTHVPLAVVEDLLPDTKLEVFLGASAGTTGYVMIDIGLV